MMSFCLFLVLNQENRELLAFHLCWNDSYPKDLFTSITIKKNMTPKTLPLYRKKCKNKSLPFDWKGQSHESFPQLRPFLHLRRWWSKRIHPTVRPTNMTMVKGGLQKSRSKVWKLIQHHGFPNQLPEVLVWKFASLKYLGWKTRQLHSDYTRPW